ncbi:hypothetical protein FB45DRAFT_945815 [Roridomyces roridus]|uniref:F-box domain-containing protein n=1 Tax=Roridomyces roridus TaxID=1738132 RepID=A0AAD7B3J5_9AGAR|nr:hypothetical protein FB45DRAFT_945815 [Roridomyces roridus]
MASSQQHRVDLCPRCGPLLLNAITVGTDGEIIDIDPPDHLALTNDPPSDIEAREVRQRIHHAGFQLANVKLELSRLHKHSSYSSVLELKLVRKRKALLKKIAANCAILAPMRRVPADVILEIFAWVLSQSLQGNPLYGSAYFRMSDDSAKLFPPWNLSHVCARWRVLSLSTSGLWENICLDGRETRNLHATIQTQLERSALRSLRISFNSSSSLNHEILAGLLVEHAHRWQSIHINFLSTAMLDVLNNCGANLNHLHIFSVERIALSQNADAYRFLLAAPNLSTVLVGAYSQASLPFEGLRLKQLRVPHNAPWLPVARQLRTLTLTGVRRDSNIELPALLGLKVDREDILTSLTAPGLQNLHVDDVSDHAAAALVGFVHRSACTLRRLSTNNPLYDMNFLAEIPAIWELGLRLPERGVPIGLSRLDISGTNPNPALPELRLLWVFHSRRSGMDRKVRSSLEEIMESRSRSAAHLTAALSVFNFSGSELPLKQPNGMIQRLGSLGISVGFWEKESASRRYEEFLELYV